MTATLIKEAHTVAKAAPFTPKAGQPKFPPMSTQFKKILLKTLQMAANKGIFTLSVALKTVLIAMAIICKG